MEYFTPGAALLGGAIIGLAASLLMLGAGRVAGISGIVGGLLLPQAGDTAWRAVFVVGLLAGGLGLRLIAPTLVTNELPRSVAALIVAGFLVGFGTRLGNGCTSGHGVCGISRGSMRSVVATVTFMASGIATAWVMANVFGGRP